MSRQRDTMRKHLRIPAPSFIADDLRVQIIGGNPLASGYECIQYASTVTPAAVYDPDVDVVYPLGLGNAWLFVNGVRQADRVLVRHAYSGDQNPLPEGRKVMAKGSETLTYSGTPMHAYLVYWL